MVHLDMVRLCVGDVVCSRPLLQLSVAVRTTPQDFASRRQQSQTKYVLSGMYSFAPTTATIVTARGMHQSSIRNRSSIRKHHLDKNFASIAYQHTRPRTSLAHAITSGFNLHASTQRGHGGERLASLV